MYSYFVLFTFWEALNIGLPLWSSFPCFWIKLKDQESNQIKEDHTPELKAPLQIIKPIVIPCRSLPWTSWIHYLYFVLIIFKIHERSIICTKKV